MSYTNIDTDYAIGTILSRFDSEYITNLIQSSIKMAFRPFSEPLPNMVAVLSRQFRGVLDNAPDYKDQILNVETETYYEIIQMICDEYNLDFDRNNDELTGESLRTFAFILYDIFVANFTNYIIMFFTTYIMRNIDQIYSYLSTDPNAKKPRESYAAAQRIYINPKFGLIHTNINYIIHNMVAYDIPFNDLLTYLTDYNTAEKLSRFLTDRNDIYKYHFASYITNPNTLYGIVTSVKLNLQQQTITHIDINTKNITKENEEVEDEKV